MRRGPRGCRGVPPAPGAAVGGAGPEAGHVSGCSTLSNAAVPAWVWRSVKVVPQQPVSAWDGFLSCYFPCCRGVPYLPPKTDSENPGFTVCVLEIKSYLCNSL